MHQSEYGPLEVGSFYWVRPVFDVDCVPDGYSPNDNISFEAKWGDWTQVEQPARFAGVDENGNEKWIFLGQDIDTENWWPVCWIGNKITRT